jgi:HlyD family secretion protein
MAKVLEHTRTENVSDIIDAQPEARRPHKRLWIYALAALALIAAVAAWRLAAKPEAPAYSTATVERDTIRKTISATGKLQALTTVQVGTQVSGTISEIYVDYNSPVKKGQVIARLDPANLQAQLTQAIANQASAQASVQTAQTGLLAADAAVEAAAANIERLDAMVRDAQINFDRTRELVAAGIGARKELDTAQAALNQAKAQRQQGVAQLNQVKAQAQGSRSQLNQARAQATQAGAQVQLASVNLQHAIVKAPIDGVIVARNVDVGQTVAASFQAPVLFLIANDLTRMQVLADIDEADVGQLQQNSKVSFAVDAYPAETFNGRISQIRLAPQTVQNVVTYTAVIDVDNPGQKLKPGMTANVTAVVAERENVLSIPNAALRFRPEKGTAEQKTQRGPAVWRINGKNLEAVPVRLGLSDGTQTEIVSGGLNEGDAVAVAAQGVGRNNAPQGANNPFIPQRSRGGGRR